MERTSLYLWEYGIPACIFPSRARAHYWEIYPDLLAQEPGRYRCSIYHDRFEVRGPCDSLYFPIDPTGWFDIPPAWFYSFFNVQLEIERFRFVQNGIDWMHFIGARKRHLMMAFEWPSSEELRFNPIGRPDLDILVKEPGFMLFATTERRMRFGRKIAEDWFEYELLWRLPGYTRWPPEQVLIKGPKVKNFLYAPRSSRIGL